ncbi:TPA: hypothetical protein N0F65_005285 [Lagenidium giganteum]|uniref:Uncharacterized protein n=1 Tax=Lagenidium giganteum TaxID=4803 RepID=A0AAV2Z1W2_9STRA|nr:TPA: hypothetical protein N0F65_005285 [Lagenidium giganteum]
MADVMTLSAADPIAEPLRSLPQLDLVETEYSDASLSAAASPMMLLDDVEPHEKPLRTAVTALLHEASSEDDAFALLREICHETLGQRRIAAAANAQSPSPAGDESKRSIIGASAPKSPQERLMAFVPNALDKGKSRYGRRGSPSHTMAEDHTPRWKKLDGDDPPVTDLAIIYTGDTIPDGFSKIDKSPSGLRADLNKGGRGLYAYLCQSKDRMSTKPPISEILAIFPDRGEFVPTDYEILQRRGTPVNVNTVIVDRLMSSKLAPAVTQPRIRHQAGEKIYLCYKRSFSSSIVDIAVVFPKKGEKVPYGFMKVDKTPDGHPADLNSGSGGTEIFLCYRKKLHTISDLQRKWLYMATTRAEESRPQIVDDGKHKITIDLSPPEAHDPKSNEIRDMVPVTPPPAPTPPSQAPDAHSPGERLQDPTSGVNALTFPEAIVAWKKSVDNYMYPLLVACYTRHGVIAEIAMQGISACLDFGLFPDSTSACDLCRLEVVTEAIASICHQGIIRKCSNGFTPGVLQAVLRTLTFIGDFDSALVKSVENELVYNVMNRYEAERCEAHAREERTHAMHQYRSTNEIAHAIVVDLIDDISTGVEIAKMTENALGAFKSHTSIHSSKFCADLHSAMKDILFSTAEKNAFQVVATLSKCVNRRAALSSDHLSERDHMSFVNSLRALNIALLATGPHSKEHRVFGQLIRRFVFSTVNSIALVWSPDVFRANLTVISTLWNHYRRHLKVELALLFEHLFLRILRSNSSCSLTYQWDIMHELIPWLQLPHNVVEIFLNFDMDRIQQWKIFEHLCAALCSIAEGNNNHNNSEDADDEVLQLQTQSINTILAIARSVMDASGHAHLIGRDARTRLLSMEHGGWEQDDVNDEPATSASPPTTQQTDQLASPTPADSKPEGVKSGKSMKYGTLSVRMRNELQKRNQQLLKRAMEISSSKSLKKAIEYLVAMNFVKETPRDVTSFLRIYHDFFDEAEIGDYLGEGDEDFKVQVRLTYARAISFKGMTLVESLRHFLTNGGFRLPGEAQKIERMVEAFAQCYWEDSQMSFSSADTAMVIAYSIIMLNTDLHNPQVKKNKMSKEQFVKNNRGIDNGKDLPKRFLEDVYDDILHHPMHIKGSKVIPKTREASMSHMDMDNDKFRGHLAKSVAQSEELMKDLSQSYFTFNFVGVNSSISPDLIKVLFERIWFYLLALSTSILCDNQADLSMTMHCLDLLRYSISTCLFLGMHIERQAFCNLLAKLQTSLNENPKKQGKGEASTEQASSEWLSNVESAVAADDPWAVIGDIHVLVNQLKDSIQQRQSTEVFKSVVKRINRSNFYLKDATHFIREGDLIKKCRSRNQVYRFFLFNDQLLYADKSMSGNWNPHNSLRLKLTRISDVADTMMHKHAFQILNPVKSFVVYAENAHAKAEWMRVIEEAITEAVKKTNRNARRLSVRLGNEAVIADDGELSEDAAATPGQAPAATSPTASAVASATSAVKGMIRRNSQKKAPEKLELQSTGTTEAIKSPSTKPDAPGSPPNELDIPGSVDSDNSSDGHEDADDSAAPATDSPVQEASSPLLPRGSTTAIAKDPEAKPKLRTEDDKVWEQFIDSW